MTSETLNSIQTPWIDLPCGHSYRRDLNLSNTQRRCVMCQESSDDQ